MNTASSVNIKDWCKNSFEVNQYSLYQPVELVEDNKQLFKQILDAFLQRYKFELPDIFAQPVSKKAAAPAP